MQDKAIPMQNILRFLESGRNDQLNFIVLDACRNNPFEKKWNRRTKINSKNKISNTYLKIL